MSILTGANIHGLWTMGDDRAILRDTWEGRLPVCFTLAEDEITAEKPDPVFVRYDCICIYMSSHCIVQGILL